MDYTLILIAVALAVFVFFQFRTSRKRAKETAERQAAIGVGVEIMTNYGLYGTILSIDEDTNVALIETTPGTVIKIHRQTILKVADYAKPEETDSEAIAEDEPAEIQLNQDNAIPAGDPQFGERAEPEVKKPARKPTKEAGE
ncbi:MAG TPA: preprotein translocase subunit YajC [Microbacteriaceae bacterium]|jgi:preprotein translocase subunit YajC|nr:preprotein translocase subunit YajC [Microbacteriaceae bacterium]